MSENITIHHYDLTREKRNDRNQHKSFVLWFTGLSGSGKSTIANKVEAALFEKINKFTVLMAIISEAESTKV